MTSSGTMDAEPIDQRETEIVDGDVVQELEQPRVMDAEEAPPADAEEPPQEAERPSRRRRSGPKSAAGPRAPREKKAPRPRAPRKKAPTPA